MRYRRCQEIGKRRENIQKRRTTRAIYGKKAIWLVRQKIQQGILGKVRKKLKMMEGRKNKRTKNNKNNKRGEGGN